MCALTFVRPSSCALQFWFYSWFGQLKGELASSELDGSLEPFFNLKNILQI
jgi:hypothetical protein